MNAVLVGGFGFIGKRLARALLDRGDAVMIVARAPGRFDGAKVIEADAYGTEEYIDALRSADIVCNLVGRRADDERANVAVAKRLVAALERVNPEAFLLQFGTRLEYGRQEKQPVSEEAACRPEEPYAEQKLAAERAVTASRLRTARLRLSTVYGPGSKGIVALMATRFAKGERFALYGDPERLKDFIHVDDVVEAVLTIIDAGATGTFNVGSGEGIAFREAAETVRETVGTGELVLDPEREDDDPAFVADVGLLREATGWRPRIPFPEGIKRTLTEERP